MAQPVDPGTLATWQGEGVRLGQVLEALDQLRRGEQRTATRASVTNLVLVVADDDEQGRACAAVHRLGRRHPGRNIVLLPRPAEGEGGIDAEVVLHGSVATGRSVWSEDVRLVVRGRPAGHLDSLIEPLTLADLPVVVWWVSGRPEPDDPLVRAADAVVLDTEGADGANEGDGPALARLARRALLIDLCWVRLRPWRQLAANLFELPECRALLGGITAVEASGPRSPRALLAGWAASRLGLAPSAVTLGEGPTPALVLRAGEEGDGGRSATFEVREEVSGEGDHLVRATARLPGGQVREDRLSLPDDPLLWSLGEALTNPARDRAHGQALQAALALA